MSKDKDYILVIASSVRSGPGTPLKSLPKVQEVVGGARSAALRAVKLARSALTDGVDSRFVQVYDAATRKPVMICHGPAITGRSAARRSASRSFAQCQIEQVAFKKAIKAKPKRKRK